MYVVVCYDVQKQKRRTRLHKRLSGMLRAVQKSVFEGEMPPAKLSALLETIGETIDRSTDTVRVYHLCKACLGLTDLVGASPTVPAESEDVVV